jgi:acyl-CoA thioesterase-1
MARIINAAVALLVAVSVWGAPVRAADAPVIIAFGDSLTAGYGLADSQSFPAQLERALHDRGFAATVVNSGVSGDTTAGGRARLDWSLPERVDLVIVELGANDGLRGIAPAETEANLDVILDALDARGIPALFAGMRAPPNLGREYVAAFDSLFPRLAKRHGVAFYPFFLEGVAAVPALNQPDGIHPNADGVARIVAQIAPMVAAALDRVAGPEPARGGTSQ